MTHSKTFINFVMLLLYNLTGSRLTWSAGTLWMNASSEYMSFMYFHRYVKSPGMWKSAKKAPATLQKKVVLKQPGSTKTFDGKVIVPVKRGGAKWSYSGDLNTGLVWYLNNRKLSDRWKVCYPETKISRVFKWWSKYQTTIWIPNISIPDMWKFVTQMFPLFRCSLFRSPLYSNKK